MLVSSVHAQTLSLHCFFCLLNHSLVCNCVLEIQRAVSLHHYDISHLSQHSSNRRYFAYTLVAGLRGHDTIHLVLDWVIVEGFISHAHMHS